MKYGEFMAVLRQSSLKHVFVLAGEEPYFINKAEKRLLVKLFPDEKDRAEGVQLIDDVISPGELASCLEEVPFFTDKNVVIVRNPVFLKEKKEKEGQRESVQNTGGKKINKKEQEVEHLLAVLENMPETNYVIFELSSKLDKRRKLYKRLEKAGLILEAEEVMPWQINEWLRAKLLEIDRRFDAGAMEYFLGAVSMMRPVPLTFMDQEIDKLALYTDKKIFSRTDLETMLSGMPEVSGFAMIDAIYSHSTAAAVKLLERQLSDGVFLPVVVSILARNVRQLLLAKSFIARGIKGRNLAVPLGDGRQLNPYIAEKIGRAAMTFDEKKLRALYLELADADYYFKTGRCGQEQLENIIIELCHS